MKYSAQIWRSFLYFPSFSEVDFFLSWRQDEIRDLGVY